MVSSAVYGYFPSRDDLLTALIIDAYNELGEAASTPTRSVTATTWPGAGGGSATRPSVGPHQHGRVRPGLRHTRTWICRARGHIGPATRFTLVLIGLMADAVRLGARPAVAVEPGPVGAGRSAARA